MILNQEQLTEINNTLEFILHYAPFFQDNDYCDDILFSQDHINYIVENSEDINSVSIYFPGDEDTEISIDEIIELSEDIKTIEVVDSGHIKTVNKTYYIVSANDEFFEHSLCEYHSLKLSPKKGVEIKLLNESLIIGLVATKLEQYDSDYSRTYSGFTAIEITYKQPSDRLSNEKELELVNSFIFEIADSTDMALSKSEIYCPTLDYIDIEDNVEKIEELRPLVPSNEGMKYFTSAIQIDDLELKFLSFYKVLEHFSPISLKIEAYELMRKKLDTPRASFDNGDYIKSIFDLANSTLGRFGDEDLIKSAFLGCFDFIGLFEKLPEKIKNNIKKQIKVQVIDYSLDPQKIITASNIAAKIIYKTRNSVVHAKSNFGGSKDDINISNELDELNRFMKEASSQAIRWYSRLPEHQKIEIIN
jgi:hypothetical protein